MNTKKYLNIFIFTFIIIFFFLLVYTHYKSEFVYDSKRLSNYIIYYVFFILGIFFFSTLLFLNQKLKESIIIISFTFIFIAYSTEGALRLIIESKNFIEIEKERRLKRAKSIYEEFGVKVETRSAFEFWRDQQKEGNNLSLLISPYRMLGTDGIRNFYKQENSNEPDKIFPLSGMSNKLTIGGAETGKYNIYKSDRYGFNNPDNEWDEKNYIAVLGDSAVHYNYYSWETGWAGNLKKLSGKSVLSLGIGNNGPLLELATLKEYALKQKPNIILWVYTEENDLLEIKAEFKSDILKKYLSKNFTQNLMKKQNFIEKNYQMFLDNSIENYDKNVGINSVEAFSIESPNNSIFLSFVKLTKLRSFLISDLIDIINSRVTDQDLFNFKNVLKEAKITTLDFKGEFYFVYLPAATKYIDSFNHPLKKNNYYRDEVLNIAKDLQIKIIDLEELYFKDLNDPLDALSFRRHSHYNPKTIENVSKIIFEIIKKERIVEY